MSAQDHTPDTAASGGASTEATLHESHSTIHAVAPASLSLAKSAPAAADGRQRPQPLPARHQLPGRAGLIAHARSAAGQLLPRLQYQVARLGVAGQTGLAALAAAAVVATTALIPGQHALQSLSAELARAQRPVGVAEVEQPAPRLIASLPTRAQMPGVIGEIYTQAKAAGVAMDSGRYRYTPAKRGAIDSYELEFPVKAAYPAIRTFINGTLTALPAVALDKLRLERKVVGDQVVGADVGFVVFMRGEPKP